ncbi:hypothetical protein OG884_18745 [Streptosporangium sp. NBC_01755]|uniref:hypothetical protein n=1 Tax=Streptosporangium sp. NBC_01755 TaxID=2975949 RepID=UPI002DD9E745|nr:hypothetical protein [Streptosporangium sp. NBC_01755]WSD01449.1 hypothetical protein OG884_05850 [Streptosporangium sp. NBC_01755]WSD03847.1 hypothetical protein OG884_18745 [Streptosporangium sp. NBC_01755]
MSIPDIFTLLALVLFGAASVVAVIHKSWVAALFCAGVFCLVLAGAGLIDT